MNLHAFHLPPFVAVLALTLSACAIPADHSNGALEKPEALMGPGWMAKELVSANAPARTVPRLQFLSSTQVAGSGGCNNFSGPLNITGSVWHLGPLASTRKFCMGPEMDVEKQFFSALERVRSASLNDGVLGLKDASGVVVLRLVRAE